MRVNRVLTATAAIVVLAACGESSTVSPAAPAPTQPDTSPVDLSNTASSTVATVSTTEVADEPAAGTTLNTSSAPSAPPLDGGLLLDLASLMEKPCPTPRADRIAVSGADGVALSMGNEMVSGLFMDAPTSDVRQARPLNALGSSADGRVIAAGVDANGPDLIVVSLDGGSSWAERGVTEDLLALAVSPSGKWLAYGDADGRLMLADASAAEFEKIPLPVEAEFVTSLVVTDSGDVVAAMPEPVVGVPAEAAALTNVWYRQSASAKWERLTELYADADIWALADNVVLSDDQAGVYFVVRNGAAVSQDVPFVSDLMYAALSDRRVVVVADRLPNSAVLADVTRSGTVWGVYDIDGEWRLVLADERWQPTDVGCARPNGASILNGDPDMYPDALDQG